MIKKNVAINLENGLEARPVALLVQMASQHECSIYIQNGSKKVNAKSIMGMMSLGLDNGEFVTIIADGDDEANAADSIQHFLSGTE